jgi:RNA polymerase sigma-70 factor, ECF subfamily
VLSAEEIGVEKRSVAPTAGACGTVEPCDTIRLFRVRSLDSAADLGLLQRIAARDNAAMAELYDRHSRVAFAIIRRILQNPSDAEEVLQEAFVRVWSRADTYDPRLGSPAGWILRIARNRAIDRLRARRARGAVDAPLAAPADGSAALPEPETHETPELLMQTAAASVAVRGAVAALPAAQRQLIEAAFFEGYTHQELAARFSVPLGTVKTRIRSGLVALRMRMEQTA